jgi:hypothetical protein
VSRPKGSKNKKTVEREAAARAAEKPLIPPEPFSEQSAVVQAHETTTKPAPAAQNFIEYVAPSGEHWRIEDGKMLMADFSVEPAEVPAWHQAMAPEKQTWHLLRSRYAIAPLAGEANPEYLQPKSSEEVGKPLGLSGQDVQGQIDNAKAFWMRWKTANKSKLDLPPAAAPPIPEDEVRVSLERYGFSDLPDQAHRQYAAQRLRDFKHKLEDEEGASLPPQAIRLELQLINIDKIIDKLAKTAENNKDDRDEMRTWMNTREKVAGQHVSIMEALNATQAQNPSVQRKIAFIDCLGTLVKGMQDYESRGDTTLIDGLHTAGEVKFLVTPTSLRPAQYRPDVVAILKDALKHENLWDPNYIPPTLDRGTHRRLLKSMQESLRAATEQDGALPDVEDDGSDSAGLVEAPLAEPMSATPTPAPTPGPRPTKAPAGNDFITA